MITINGKNVKCSKFNGGECHVKIPKVRFGCNIVESYLYSSDDIMFLMLTIDAMRRVNQFAEIHLIIPYFPYSRQDRVCNIGEALSVKIMADLINMLKLNSVLIYDPHSYVVYPLLNNCLMKPMPEIIKNSLLKDIIIENNLILVSPDSGSEKKVRDLANIISHDNILYASKVRNTKNGEITETKVSGVENGKKYIIVDDICDGGRTFIELAKIIKKQGASKVYLYVTHGIFSKGLDVLKEYIDKVYCYYTFLNNIDSEYLTILRESYSDYIKIQEGLKNEY